MYLLIKDGFQKLTDEKLTKRGAQFTRVLEQCEMYFGQKLEKEHPPTSITNMGMAAANLSLAYKLTQQPQYLEEAKRWLFTACNYPCWGYGFLVDVDLSASWLLFGFGLAYDWIKEDLTEEERTTLRDKLILQGHKMFEYGETNKGNCWSTDYWQNHNWINYTGLLTTAYAIEDEYEEAKKWAAVIEENFKKVFAWMPADGSNYEGTGYWRYAMHFMLAAADMIRQKTGVNHFASPFLTNTFYYRLYQSAPNWEENINFSDVHDRRSSHSIASYYKFAQEYDNGYAQWLGALVADKLLFREAYQSKIFPGIMPDAFLEYIWYTPEVEKKAPQDLPLTRFFPDLGLAVIRSSWEKDAIHFSIKSSAPGGHAQWHKSWELDRANGWRTRSLTHYHVDFNSFILMAHDSSLAIDEGFHRTSRAKVHNMITVDDTGCVGEKIWDEGTLADPVLFDLNCKGIHNVWRDVPEEAVAEVEAFVSESGYTYYCAESSKMYYEEMLLKRNARNVLYSENGYFIIMDELVSDMPHTYTWRLHGEQFATKVAGKDYYCIKNGKGALNIYPVSDQETQVKVEETLIQEIMTPQRPTDVRELKLKTLCVENAEKCETMRFMTVLEPVSSFEESKLSVERLKADTYAGIRVVKGNLCETFLYQTAGSIQHKHIETDAAWVSIVEEDGRLVKYMISKGTYLIVDGNDVYHTEEIKNVFSQQIE